MRRAFVLSVLTAALAIACVPAMPTDVIRYMRSGGTLRITSALPNAGGGGVMPALAGPSAMPRGPWHDAQCCA